jgi:sugar/nucleoside kinase (ribokinase family)
VVLANADEARALTGLGPDEAVRALAAQYRVACVKLGPAGAVAASGDAVARAPAQAFEPAGALGAGDAFAAGLLLALAGGSPFDEALARGCAAASTHSRELARSERREMA